jgi:hypothetical protein
MTMTLKNLVVGDQDPALFELPGGYTPMPGMGGFATAIAPPANAAGANPAEAPATPADAAGKPADAVTPGSVAREVAKQTIFKLPGLLGR